MVKVNNTMYVDIYPNSITRDYVEMINKYIGKNEVNYRRNFDVSN